MNTVGSVGAPSTVDGAHSSLGGADEIEKDKLFGLVMELTSPEHRETALLELSKRRTSWHCDLRSCTRIDVRCHAMQARTFPTSQRCCGILSERLPRSCRRS